jgi:tetratricopeptide (TPR) repeat protein
MATPSTTPSERPSGFGKPTWIALALTVATLLVYGQTVGSEFEFLNVDDPDYVTQNPHVQQGLTGSSIWWALTALYAYNWHPLTWMSLQLDYQLHGLSSRGFHLTNVLLHTANTLLLFWVLQRLTGAIWRSGAAAALFALHPLHVQSVAWVTERKDVVSTLFLLLTLAAYAWYAERPGVARYLLVMLLFALGLMGKPMLVTVPALLLLFDYWPLRRWAPWDNPSVAKPLDPEAGAIGASAPPTYNRASLGWLIAEKLPLFALVVATIPLTVRAQGVVVRTLEQFPVAIRVQNVLISYVRYLVMTLWPANLAIFYPFPRHIPLWQPLAAGVLLAGVTGAVFWAGRRRPYLLVGWLWYLGTLVPVIGFVQVGMQAVADRYTYVPLIGFFIFLAWGTADVLAGRLRPLALGALVGSLLTACGMQAWLQVRHWRNSTALWQHAIDVVEDNYTAHDYLGTALVAQGKLDDARHQFELSLAILSRNAATHGNLALVLERQGRLHEATRHFQESLRINPQSALAHTGLGRVRERQGQLDAARQEYAQAVAIDPAYVEAHLRLGELLEGQGQLQQALEHYQTAAAVESHNPSVHDHLGTVLRRLGRTDEALAQYELALQLDPSYAEAHNNRGVTLEKLGRWPEAVACFQQAVDLQPEHLLFRCNLAYALHETGQTAAARTQYIEAFHIYPNWPQVALEQAWTRATDPDPGQRSGAQALRAAKQVCQATGYQQPQALDTLAAAYAELGEFDEAVAWARKALELVPAEKHAALARGLAERVRLYEKHQPYRQPTETSKPSQKVLDISDKPS